MITVTEPGTTPPSDSMAPVVVARLDTAPAGKRVYSLIHDTASGALRLEPGDGVTVDEAAAHFFARINEHLSHNGPDRPTVLLPYAVAVLNRYRHRGHSEWVVDHGSADPARVRPAGVPAESFDSLSEWEAVAVAEKYLRDGLTRGA